MEKKTPLYECHIELKGKIVPFAGYLLPVQYDTGVITEHNAVRNSAGLFDVSHMGEVFIEGPDAYDNIQMLVTNDISTMPEGKARYSPMCNEEGGTVDDLIIFKFNDNKYMLGVNASNKDKDYEWIKKHVKGNVNVLDMSDEIAQVALQGPMSGKILEKITDPSQLPDKYYTFRDNIDIAGIDCFVSRTGYTGEFGYEISVNHKYAIKLWNTILEAGKEYNLIPCGLGARDTLRLEAAMPLYGHELDEDISPLEAALDFAVKMNKDFIGKEKIIEKGINRRRVGLKITGRGIVREHCVVYYEGKEIGVTTSGTHSPTLGYPIAMALLDTAYNKVGTEVNVMVRGREISAVICPLPFLKK